MAASKDLFWSHYLELAKKAGQKGETMVAWRTIGEYLDSIFGHENPNSLVNMHQTDEKTYMRELHAGANISNALNELALPGYLEKKNITSIDQEIENLELEFAEKFKQNPHMSQEERQELNQEFSIRRDNIVYGIKDEPLTVNLVSQAILFVEQSEVPQQDLSSLSPEVSEEERLFIQQENEESRAAHELALTLLRALLPKQARS